MGVSIAELLNTRRIMRLLIAGTTWGLLLSIGFLGIAMRRCGLPCPNDVLVVTTLCIVTGILTVGPVAVFGCRAD
ncbi:MAG TPA: hypothetical protein VFP60_08965 [Pseudolabrys sp.]|nr:hypothetical protein [Pseudolabrys sp.]